MTRRTSAAVSSAINSSAADAAFGWRPELDLDEGLADTFRWYAATTAP